MPHNKLLSRLWTVTGLVALLLLSAGSQTSKSQPVDGGVASKISAQYRSSTIFIAVKGTRQSGEEEEWKVGSGFVVSAEGYTLSVAHMFRDAKGLPYAQTKILGSLGASFDLSLPVGDIKLLQLIRMSTDVDAALVKLPFQGKDNPYNAVHVCRGNGIVEGARVHSLGFPLGMPLSINSGTLSSKNGPRGLWKTDLLLNEGNSGGPIFDETGHVIGVVKGGIADAPGNNFFIPVNLVVDLLQSAMAEIDDCANVPAITASPDLCARRVVAFDLDFVKADHPQFAPDSRVFAQTFSAQSGFSFEKVQWIPASVNHADDPDITLAENNTVLRAQTTLSSGPFFDKWRGWISGKIVTTQKPVKCPA